MIDEDSLPILAQHWLVIQSSIVGEIEAEEEFHQFQWMVELSAPVDSQGYAREMRAWNGWCRDNVRDFWGSTSSLSFCAFLFSDRGDAMLFVLSYGGQLVDLRPFITSQP
jgi:hypothetical protein